MLGTKKKDDPYHRTRCADGDVVIEMLQLSNVSEVGKEIIDSLNDASGLTLKSALDVKKYEEELNGLLEKIKDVVRSENCVIACLMFLTFRIQNQSKVGLASDCTLENDLVAFDAVLSKLKYVSRCGEFQLDYIKVDGSLYRSFGILTFFMQALFNNLKNQCKEELTKEAVAEAWTTGVIRFEGVKTLKSGYHRWVEPWLVPFVFFFLFFWF